MPVRFPRAKREKMTREKRKEFLKRGESAPPQPENTEDIEKRIPKKLLTGGQSKIAKKAPPFNKIDEKDFEVLRAEKAKGRGKGLQDEKVKPGKVMKARIGVLIKPKGPGVLRPKPTVGGKPLKPKPMKPKKKMGGGLAAATARLKAKGLNKGGGADTGKVGEEKSKTKVSIQRLVRRIKGDLEGATKPYMVNKKMGGGMMKRPMSYNKGGGADYMNTVKAKKRGNPPVLGLRPNRKLERDKVPNPKKSMGGGMMQKPMPLMGYKKGKMIMARGCKLGRKKATKIT